MNGLQIAMNTAKIILPGLFGGLWGFAITQAFQGHLNNAIGFFIIGCFVVVFYLVIWMIDTA